MNSDVQIYVTGWSQHYNIESLTKQQALNELDEVKRLFKAMVDESKELNEFAQEKEIKYKLAYNYGMGSIGICHEEADVIKWERELLN